MMMIGKYDTASKLAEHKCVMTVFKYVAELMEACGLKEHKCVMIGFKDVG
ncbi:hypothetical protein CASFOL_027009 [Castilleja foliolosa]|uniref:Uncharacterized protein n=1 Tax=Castilleja foliolosa TaxID=1961234 RepID=A0ABD3CJM1_9LAMI